MTLTPSVRAISLCNFPCVANLFACASFVAISTLECLFVSAIAACLVATAACHRPFASYANFIAGNVLFFYRGQRVVFIAGNVLFLLGQRVVPLPVPEGGADSSGTHSPTKKSRRNGNYCRAAN
jgi:hypothetical protein